MISIQPIVITKGPNYIVKINRFVAFIYNMAFHCLIEFFFVYFFKVSKNYERPKLNTTLKLSYPRCVWGYTGFGRVLPPQTTCECDTSKTNARNCINWRPCWRRRGGGGVLLLKSKILLQNHVFRWEYNIYG